MNIFIKWNVIDPSPGKAGSMTPAEHAGPADGLSESPLHQAAMPLVHQAAVPLVKPPIKPLRSTASASLAGHRSLHGLQLGLQLGMQFSPPQEVIDAVKIRSTGYGKQVFSGVVGAARKWHADDASTMAAGVAYYLALSLFPMLLLLTAGLGLVFRFTSQGHDAEVQILSVVAEHCSPSLEQQVRVVLSQLREQSLVGGPFGLVTAVLAAIGVFHQFERAFDRIWRIKAKEDADWWSTCKRVITQRLSAFLLLTSVGVAIVLVLLANVAVGFVHAWMLNLHIPGTVAISGVDAMLTLLLNAAVFGMLYRWLPKGRVGWSDAFRGGLLAAIIWEVGRQLLGAILIGVRYTAAYGAIGSFIALLLWCYWGVSIIFFGAEYAQVLSQQRRDRKSVV